MICFPNAKINLGLRVVGRRADGYHNIESVFIPLPLRDALEVVPSDTDEFHLSGIMLDAASGDNLVVKAWRLFASMYPLPPLAVYLRKVIPFGAGLGGGSSDAAFMLKLLNNYANTGLSQEKLEEMAGLLGADCPFFIHNYPLLVSGTGNRFENITLSLNGYTVVLVKPDIFISTKEAYSLVRPETPAVPLAEIISKPVSEWKESLVNDFELPIFREYPQISAIKDTLYDHGACYAAMSGSGSAVFGLFKQNVQVHFPGCFVWKGTW
ncbi:MAG: 4-(cytidine 5'-diphospho)-2-C-methyl-D-erythritol kinase [Tannerella sp.]|jgi:4-diphosphocytidyl-2-C-methyl-D-erythritol kinase|nr:4-(cytidine 5'-diphospho)-2-C-methyl-D-erythritol kinase [Tannerella sp.]